ncbi:histamine H2 receptor isoform X2 [Hydra vulgaris]|uniref:Histamine H2 receptor isoform X2 n=1 Tax=Hydra vulgaris TaxID=6087 RepID=A0ABM4BJV5_HYDVU
MAQIFSSNCSGIWAPIQLSYFTAACSFFLAIVTVSGNLLIVLAVYKDPHKKLSTPYMLMLVNLAATDLVVGLITMPMSVATHYLEALGTKKETHVTVSRIIHFTSCSASVLNLVALCVDRYIAVTLPFKYRQLLNSKVCLCVSIFIWIIAIIIGMLYFAFDFMQYLFVFAQVAVTLALIICAITHSLLKKLQKSSKERQEITNRSLNHRVRTADKKVMKLFLTILLWFLLCYIPAITMMYTLKFCRTCDCTSRHVFRDLQVLFIASNSAVNPYACAIRLRSFRNALKAIFTKKLKVIDDDEFSPKVSQIFSRISLSSFRRYTSPHRSYSDDNLHNPTMTIEVSPS